MKRFGISIAGLIIMLTLLGCNKPAETPSEVMRAYGELLDALDPDMPGESYARLKQFAIENAQYDVVTIVELELEDRIGSLDAAYRYGRDLAREEQFYEAEAVLNDLAINLQDESAGELARSYLHFDFPFLMAQRLLMAGNVAGAEEVARELAEKQLTAEQMIEAQQLLDSISTTRIGLNMAHNASLMSAARMLQAHINVYYAEWGRYPEELNIESPELASFSHDSAFRRSVQAIEDYATRGNGFSLVIIGNHSNERLTVTEAGVEKAIE